MTNQKLTLGELFQFIDDLNSKIASQNIEKHTKLLTRKEVAEILNVSLPTLHDWTKNGKITGFRIGSRVLYKSHDIYNSLSQINISISKGGKNGN